MSTDDLRPPGRIVQRSLPLFEELRESGPPALGFLARLFVMATLPHSRPAGNEFVRRNGRYSLHLIAPSECGLPYGLYPRLTAAWICTQAVQTQSRELRLGSIRRFAGDLGITPAGGPKGTLKALREQLQRLLRMSIDFAWTDERGQVHGQGGGGIRIASEYSLWWDEEGRATRDESWIVLSKDFYSETAAHPVPFSMDVLRQFRSPMEVDLYIYLTHRALRTLKLQGPETISWEALAAQFGSNYEETRNFRTAFRRSLKAVLQLYASPRVELTPAGIVLRPYQPDIPVRRSVVSA